MAKIKLTKNEYKKQKDSLKMYTRYLPTLILKKQQLQMEIQAVIENARRVELELEAFHKDIVNWISLFSENEYRLEDLLKVEKLLTDKGNIAGVDIPVFVAVDFEVFSYDIFEYPLWIDEGIEAIKQSISLKLKHRIYQEQKRLLERELQITTQRVNLFEKVRIPETKSNIKKIAIYLGDQQTAAVVRGKISKRNLEAKVEGS